MSYTKFNRNKAIKVFMKKGCNISQTCLELGIARSTFYKQKDDDPVFAEMVADAEETVIDDVESKLLDKINAGDTTSIIFFLKTKGKRRSYVENPKLAVSLNQNVQGNVIQERKVSMLERQEVARDLLQLFQKQGKYEATTTSALHKSK